MDGFLPRSVSWLCRLQTCDWTFVCAPGPPYSCDLFGSSHYTRRWSSSILLDPLAFYGTWFGFNRLESLLDIARPRLESGPSTSIPSLCPSASQQFLRYSTIVSRDSQCHINEHSIRYTIRGGASVVSFDLDRATRIRRGTRLAAARNNFTLHPSTSNRSLLSPCCRGAS